MGLFPRHAFNARGGPEASSFVRVGAVVSSQPVMSPLLTRGGIDPRAVVLRLVDPAPICEAAIQVSP